MLTRTKTQEIYFGCDELKDIQLFICKFVGGYDIEI